jgi:hypothetical protein
MIVHHKCNFFLCSPLLPLASDGVQVKHPLAIRVRLCRIHCVEFVLQHFAPILLESRSHKLLIQLQASPLVGPCAVERHIV